MAMIHISIAEAARDFAALIEQVNAGAEFMIEDGQRQLAVLRSPMPGGRTLSESIMRAEAYTAQVGYKPTMDADFAADVKEIIANRMPANRDEWD